MSQNPPPSCYPSWPWSPCRFECGVGDVSHESKNLSPHWGRVILASGILQEVPFSLESSHAKFDYARSC
jgi:hypothetical protein